VTLGRDRHREWQRLITRAGLAALLPSDFTEAIRQVAAFGDPGHHRQGNIRPLGASANSMDAVDTRSTLRRLQFWLQSKLG
jgi:hypothetical protein